MSDVMMQEVLTRLDALTAQLGKAGAFSWEVLVRQAFWVNGVIAVAMTLTFGVAAFLALRLGLRWAAIGKAEGAKEFLKRDFDRQVRYEVSGWVLIVLASISIIFIPFLLFDALAHMLNPSYYAIRELLSVLK